MTSPPTAAGLLRLAARCTSSTVERGVGVLLGANPEDAAAAVDAIRTAGRLSEGLALHALVHAARKGMDAEHAVAALAGGAALPSDWSDYEVRAAGDEAREDVEAALRAPRGRNEVDATGPEAPAVAAAALRTGDAGGIVLRTPAEAHMAGGSLLAALVDDRWVRRLAAAAGWRVRRTSPADRAGALQATLDAGAALPAGVDVEAAAVEQRSTAYVALLP